MWNDWCLLRTSRLCNGFLCTNKKIIICSNGNVSYAMIRPLLQIQQSVTCYLYWHFPNNDVPKPHICTLDMTFSFFLSAWSLCPSTPPPHLPFFGLAWDQCFPAWNKKITQTHSPTLPLAFQHACTGSGSSSNSSLWLVLLCIPIIPLSKSGHFCTSGSSVTYNHFVFWTMQKGLNASVKSHLWYSEKWFSFL